MSPDQSPAQRPLLSSVACNTPQGNGGGGHSRRQRQHAGEVATLRSLSLEKPHRPTAVECFTNVQGDASGGARWRQWE